MSEPRTRPVTVCAFPVASALPGHLEVVSFTDSYSVDLDRPEMTIQSIYLALFAHHPWWARALLLLRTRIVSLFGIGGPTARQMARIEIEDAYTVGEKIGLFTLVAQDQDEIIAGGNDRHLDFRVSVLRLRRDSADRVVVTTVVKTHNLFGRIYLAMILPFHRFGVKHMLWSAAANRRL